MAYDDLLKIRTWSLDGAKTANITDLVQAKTWSGSYQDCCRTLSFDVLPEALCQTGGSARLYHHADVLFSGRIVDRDRDTSAKVISCVAYDRGIYLKNNKVYRAYTNRTPESVARELCGEFGIPAGSFAVTGVKLTRNFLNVGIYQVIQTLYTLASEKTGRKYQVRFTGDALNVVVKEKNAASIRLIPGSNLLWCRAQESIKDLMTSVAVYSDEMKLTATYDSPDGYRALYGLMQAAVKASDNDDPAATAKQLLEDNGISTTITAQCIGNTKLITGNTVVVHEPVTGTDGLFWILSDSHTFSRGIYQTKLTLDFRNLMDKQEAGSVPTK